MPYVYTNVRTLFRASAIFLFLILNRMVIKLHADLSEILFNSYSEARFGGDVFRKISFML